VTTWLEIVAVFAVLLGVGIWFGWMLRGEWEADMAARRLDGYLDAMRQADTTSHPTTIAESIRRGAWKEHAE